jgi:Fe-S-cluster-containing dehydrogenase component
MKVSRRDFLKLSGVVIGLSLTGRSTSAIHDFSGWPKRVGMLSDTTRCIGCRRCEEACNKSNNLPPIKTSIDDESVFEEERHPYVADVQAYTAVNRYHDSDGKPVYRKVQCMHCEEPACASACLVGAFKKTPEGAVIWNHDVCVGCRYCMTACPFYVPAFEYSSAFDPRIQKCFMCYHQRISKGIIPACAEACPVEAITFGRREQLIEVARERIKAEPDKYIHHIYGEHEVGGTGWMYISGVEFEKLNFPTNLGTDPIPELTKEFLSFVPIVITMWPAFFGGFYLISKHNRELAENQNVGLEQEDDTI